MSTDFDDYFLKIFISFSVDPLGLFPEADAHSSALHLVVNAFL